jgi:dCTP deaminase
LVAIFVLWKGLSCCTFALGDNTESGGKVRHPKNSSLTVRQDRHSSFIIYHSSLRSSVIFSDKKILEAIAERKIVIEPFRPECLGTNSYDVHLGKHLAVYAERVLDARKHNQIEHFDIPEEGFVLQPGILYLGVTEEYTETHNSVPFLEGKSSIGRLGIDIHATAGKGDVGFCNTWTLEISCVQPVRVYAGMPVGQLIYFSVEGDIQNYYNRKQNAKYNQRTEHPVESMMWRNF